MNGVGAGIESAVGSRDVLWANIQRATLGKVSQQKKTGSGGSEQLAKLGETVLDIVGHESANLEPAQAPDTDIVIAEIAQECLTCTTNSCLMIFWAVSLLKMQEGQVLVGPLQLKKFKGCRSWMRR